MRFYVTFVFLATIISAHALDFAFKKGVPTKVTFKPSCNFEDGGYTLSATLSDGNHTETICIFKTFNNEAGGAYEYWGSRTNGSDGRKIEINDRGDALGLFQKLEWHQRQQDAQKKKK